MTRTITYTVTAPEGRAIPGLGSRRQGETFVVPARLAGTLDGDPGLTREQPKRASKRAADQEGGNDAQ